MAQLKDLLVLVASRFLNIIHGDIDGNAATADKVNNVLTITTPNGGSQIFDGHTGTLELICAGLDEVGVSVDRQTKTKNSHWAILGNNEVWGTY